MIFKIYVPDELRFFYADRYGNQCNAPSDAVIVPIPPSPIGVPIYDPTLPDNAVVEAPYTEAEALRMVRKLRTDRLYQCDWTQLTDTPLSDAQRERWQAYRQALRDMMDNFEWNVTTWPEL